MPADRLVGTTIAHYQVLTRLGTGGMGVVYLADDLRLKRKVALKFLTAPDDERARARLLREAQAASALDHPNIATVYEVGEAGGQPYIAMAYYPGETLQARLKRGPMGVAEIVDVTAQLAAGLAAAHAAGVVHRDLKPANVILTASQVKILDFGLATAGREEIETITRLTQEGTAVGTLGYMSPEQAQGRDVDPRTDVWSLGTVLYEMLVGQSPFEERTPAALLLALVSREPARASTLRAGPVELGAKGERD